jgi:hypothetical protein
LCLISAINWKNSNSIEPCQKFLQKRANTVTNEWVFEDLKFFFIIQRLQIQ